MMQVHLAVAHGASGVLQYRIRMMHLDPVFHNTPLTSKFRNMIGSEFCKPTTR